MIKDPDCISDTVPRKTLSFSDSEKHASSPIAGEGKKNVISTFLCKRLHYKGNKEDIISSSIPETHSLGSAESASHKLPISALTNSFMYDSFYQQHQPYQLIAAIRLLINLAAARDVQRQYSPAVSRKPENRQVRSFPR